MHILHRKTALSCYDCSFSYKAGKRSEVGTDPCVDIRTNSSAPVRQCDKKVPGEYKCVVETVVTFEEAGTSK